ncbi:MAG: hypothetical protein QHC67_04585 [Sphingobium sp.]|uniref:hypothetical protein n=1 Tax=Sphingobium sp. TaxID=1912891 RepID=UPI0029A2AF81|nr:hypothetical protein [Sphingobium sp.]MDX3909077.1 hypothetical protein [Sphingobium sp.]
MTNKVLSDAEIAAQLAALSAMEDSDIDTSDIPEVEERFWANAERGRFYRLRVSDSA